LVWLIGFAKRAAKMRGGPDARKREGGLTLVIAFAEG